LNTTWFNNVDKGELQVRTQDEEVTLNLFSGLKNFNAGEECVQKDGSKRYSTHLEIKKRQARLR